MSELRWLDLSVEVTEEPAWGITDVVTALPQLQRLQKLSLYGMQVWPEFHDAVDTFLAEKTAAAKQAMAAAEAAAAAGCKALTGRFYLSSLRLRDCWLPGAAVSRMFPASGWMPFLQVIDVTCCEGTLEFFDFQEEPFDPASDVRRCSLRLEPGNLTQIIRCCPQLRELSTLWADKGIKCSELQQLQRLKQLTKLVVGGFDWNDEAAESVLAKMTGLQELDVWCARQLTVKGLACLTALKQLSGLWVLGSKISFENDVTSNNTSNKSDSKGGSDGEEPKYKDVQLLNKDCNVPVYQQLEQLCSSSLAGLAAMLRSAQQQIAEKDLELKKQQEECKARTKQLKEGEDQLWRRRLQLCKVQQQLQQQEQQLEAQEAELAGLRQMRDTIMMVAQQVLPAAVQQPGQQGQL